MTDPDWQKVDWDAETMKRWGKTVEELSAEAEAGYDISTMRTRTRYDLSRVTRFEVIDHRMETIAAEQPVRAIVAYGAKVRLSFQDSGTTLKVFLTDPQAKP